MMPRNRARLTMSPEGGRTLVTVMESGAIKFADDLTATELAQALMIVNEHTRERRAEEDRLRAEVKRLGG